MTVSADYLFIVIDSVLHNVEFFLSNLNLGRDALMMIREFQFKYRFLSSMN